MYHKEEEKIKAGFEDVAPDLFEKIKQKEVRKIASEEELFGELQLQEKQRETEQKVISLPPRIALGSIAAAILCILICAQFIAPRAQATKIMIDINSKMQFVVTESNRKIKVEAFSADGEKIVKAIPGGDTLEETVYEVLEQVEQYECFEKNDAGMLVSYVNQKKQDSKEKVSNIICQYFKKEKLQVSLVQQEVKEEAGLQQEADKQGVSLGKYCFLKNIQDEYKIDAKTMYQKDMGDILQEIQQQGIDLSKDSRIEYLSAEQVTEQVDVTHETQEKETSAKEEGEKKKDKSEATETFDKSENKNVSQKKKKQNNNTQISEDEKSDHQEDKKSDGQKSNVSPEPPVSPIVTAIPLPTTNPQVSAEVTEYANSTAQPAATPFEQKEQPQEKEKDKQEQGKYSEEKKDSSKGNHGNKEHDWGKIGHNQSLDWDVDDIQEKIKEYMKNHPHSKKGYSQSYQEWSQEVHQNYIEQDKGNDTEI